MLVSWLMVSQSASSVMGLCRRCLGLFHSISFQMLGFLAAYLISPITRCSQRVTCSVKHLNSFLHMSQLHANIWVSVNDLPVHSVTLSTHISLSLSLSCLKWNIVGWLWKICWLINYLRKLISNSFYHYSDDISDNTLEKHSHPVCPVSCPMTNHVKCDSLASILVC